MCIDKRQWGASNVLATTTCLLPFVWWYDSTIFYRYFIEFEPYRYHILLSTALSHKQTQWQQQHTNHWNGSHFFHEICSRSLLRKRIVYIHRLLLSQQQLMLIWHICLDILCAYLFSFFFFGSPSWYELIFFPVIPSKVNKTLTISTEVFFNGIKFN